jgi:hypothetical protein
MKKYQKLSMFAEAKEYCIGILRGTYKFEKESTSEYKDWAVYAPAECFGWVLNEWKERQKGVTDEELREVREEERI